EQCPKNPRESDAICTVELDPRWTPALKGLETVTHVLLLYWMDRTRRDLVLQVPRHYGEQRGTFALRSPARPNPIAVAVARLVRIEGNAPQEPARLLRARWHRRELPGRNGSGGVIRYQKSSIRDQL